MKDKELLEQVESTAETAGVETSVGIAYSILIPCYNEQGAIRDTIDAVVAACDASLPKDSFEVLVIDDGSTDASVAVIEMVADMDARVRLVRHRKNKGYGASLKTGLGVARVSTATRLASLALSQARDAAREWRDTGRFAFLDAGFAYPELQRLFPET